MHSLETRATAPLSARRWIPALASLVAIAASLSCGSDGPSVPWPRAVSTLTVASGDRQSASAGTALSAPVVFIASDASGRPVPGVVVTFAVTAGGGTVSPSTDTSDALGHLDARWTVGTTASAPQELLATVTSATDQVLQPVRATATVAAGPPAALAVTPTSISARVGDTIAKAIVVTVRDQYGNASVATRSAVNVRLQETDRAIAAGAISVQTDSTGTATFSGLSITGRAGAATLVIESTGVPPARLALDLTAGPPASVTLDTTVVDATAHAPGPPIRARVLDAWKNAVAGITMSFTVDGVGEIGRAVSDSTGVATLSTWRAPGTGNYRLVATVSGSSITEQATLVSRNGAPVGVVLAPASPTIGTAGSDLTISVAVVDVGANVLPNQPIDWSVANGASGHDVSDVDGIAHLTIRLLQKAGQNQVTLKSGSVSTTIAVTGKAGPAARVQPTAGPSSAPAGSTLSVGFRVADQYDNPIAGIVVPQYQPFGLTANAPSAITNSDGIATFTVVLNQFAMPNYMRVNLGFVGGYAAATIYGTASRGTLFLDDMSPSCPVKAPAPSEVVVVAVFDASGHPAVNVPVTFSTSTGNGVIRLNAGPSVSSTVVPTFGADAGFALVLWGIPATVGTYTLTAQILSGSYAQSPMSIVCSVTP